MGRRKTGNSANKLPFRGKPFDPRDWSAHTDSYLVEQLLDVLAAGDPAGDASLMAMEVTRRGLEALAEATVRHRRTA